MSTETATYEPRFGYKRSSISRELLARRKEYERQGYWDLRESWQPDYSLKSGERNTEGWLVEKVNWPCGQQRDEDGWADVSVRYKWDEVLKSYFDIQEAWEKTQQMTSRHYALVKEVLNG